MASGIVESSHSDNQDSSKNRTPAAQARARLVQKLLSSSGDLPAFIKNLIEAQGVFVAGTEAAAFLIEQQSEKEFGLRPIAHVRPDESTPEVRSRALEAFADIVRPCVVQGKDGVIEVDGSKKDAVDPQFCLVTLLRSGGNVVAVSAVITRAPNMARAQQRLTSMELVAGYFEMYTLQRTSEQARLMAATHQNVLQLATSVATAEGFESAAMNLCNELAARTGATRVAIGWVQGFPPKIKLRAMSHTEKFDKKQELSVLIVAAMEECLDQEDTVHYEPSGEGGSRDRVTRAAAELSRTQGGVSIINLPLRRGGDITGVVCLEFNPQKKLGSNASTGLAVATELLAPQLYDRYQNDRWWITKTGMSIRETAKMAIGPKHMLAKLLIIIGVASLLFTIFYKPMHKVTAPFTFAATDKRILSAPFDGYIGDKVLVRPGDMVEAGQTMMEMDTSELKLDWANKAGNARAKFQEFQRLAGDPSKTAEALQAKTEAQAFQADADLAQIKIDRAIIKAPFAGRVLSGEWVDKKFTPVRKGEELFQVAEGQGLRVVLNVNERDIQYVRDDGNQEGYFATTTLPNDKIKFKIERVIPKNISMNGQNVFEVYGTPEKIEKTWRDGMQGEARVHDEPRRLIWIWTHPLVDWVRLKTWWF